MTDLWELLGFQSSRSWLREQERRIAEERRRSAERARLPGPVGSSPPASSVHVLLTGRRGTENVLYEYEDGARVREASLVRGRSWYQAGDVVLVTEQPMRTVVRIFPELGGSGGDDDDLLVLDLALGFLGESPPQYKIGWKLVRVGPETEPGNGSNELRGFIFFGDNMVELEARRTQSTRELASDFVMARAAGRLAAMIPILEAVAQLALDVVSGASSGAVRSLGRWTLRGALRAGVRRTLVRAITRALTSAAAAITLGFVRGVAVEIRNRNEEATLRARAGARSLEAESLRPYLVAGVRGAVSAAFDELGDAAVEGLRGRSGSGGSTASWREQLTQAITEEIVRRLISLHGGVLVTSAVQAAGQTERPFGQAFANAAWEAIQGEFRSLLRSLITRPTGAVAAAMDS